MAVTLTNSFEGGTSGNGITAGNSGGSSGNAFDVVTGSGTTHTSTYDNAVAAHGSLSCNITTSAGQQYVSWTTSLTGSTIATVYFRVYLYYTANPPGTNDAFCYPLSGGSRAAEYDITTAGVVLVANASGTGQHTGSVTIPLNAWCRVEGWVTGNASTGQFSYSLYTTPDSTTAAETFTSAATINTGGAINGIRFGSSRNITQTKWQDDLGASDTGPLGPVVTGSPSQGTGGDSGTVAALIAAGVI